MKIKTQFTQNYFFGTFSFHMEPMKRADRKYYFIWIIE